MHAAESHTHRHGDHHQNYESFQELNISLTCLVAFSLIAAALSINAHQEKRTGEIQEDQQEGPMPQPKRDNVFEFHRQLFGEQMNKWDNQTRNLGGGRAQRRWESTQDWKSLRIGSQGKAD